MLAAGAPLIAFTPLEGLGVMRQAARGMPEVKAWKSWISAAADGFWGISTRYRGVGSTVRLIW